MRRSFPLLFLLTAVACANGGPGPGSSFGRNRGDNVPDGGSIAPPSEDGGVERRGCGFVGDACCPTATPCAEGRCVDGTCDSCGDPGETCCPGTPCPGGGVCSAGTCEGCGTSGALCCPGAICEAGASCIDGRCASPAPEGGPVGPACAAEEIQTRPCGRCGIESRSCAADGTWNAYSGCTGEGECTPGDTDGRTECSAECTWGTFNTCSLSTCPSGTHISALACDGTCSAPCSIGYNALTCAINTARFTVCGNCPAGYRGVAGACEPGCQFPCSGGVNATVCDLR